MASLTTTGLYLSRNSGPQPTNTRTHTNIGLGCSSPLSRVHTPLSIPFLLPLTALRLVTKLHLNSCPDLIAPPQFLLAMLHRLPSPSIHCAEHAHGHKSSGSASGRRLLCASSVLCAPVRARRLVHRSASLPLP
jgi:hypothetical protein